MVYSSFPPSLSQKEIVESLQNNITKGKPSQEVILYFITIFLSSDLNLSYLLFHKLSLILHLFPKMKKNNSLIKIPVTYFLRIIFDSERFDKKLGNDILCATGNSSKMKPHGKCFVRIYIFVVHINI